MKVEEPLKIRIKNNFKESFIEEYDSIKSLQEKTNSLIKMFIDIYNEGDDQNVDIVELGYNDFCMYLEEYVEESSYKFFGDDTFIDFSAKRISSLPIEEIDEITNKYINIVNREEPNISQDEMYIKANSMAVKEIVSKEYKIELKKVTDECLKKIIEKVAPSPRNKEEREFFNDCFKRGFEQSVEKL
jgi:hypothetical protein